MMNVLNYDIKLLTIQDVAEILKLSVQSIRRLIKANDLEPIYLSDRCMRISKQSIDNYLNLKQVQSKVIFRNNQLTNKSKDINIHDSSNFQGCNMKKKNFTSLGNRNGYIIVRKTVNRKSYLIYSGRDQLEAEKKLAEFQLKVLNNQQLTNTNEFFDNQIDVTFKSYAEKFLEQFCKVYHRTYKTDISRYRALLPFFRNVKLKDISYAMVKDYISYRQKQYSKVNKAKDGSLKKVSPITVNRELAFLSSMFGEALRDGLIEKHPTMHMKLKLEEREKDIHPIIDFKKIIEFISYFPESIKPIIQIMVYSGFRINTVLKLKKESFNPETNEIIILRQHSKSKKQQIFPMSKDAVNVLVSIENESEYFFLNPRTKKPFRDIRISYKRAVLKAKLHPDTTAHDLRRSYGTNLVRMGYPLKVVSRAMGHSSIKVTERYLRLSEEHDIKPMVNDYAEKLNQGNDNLVTNLVTLSKYRKSS